MKRTLLLIIFILSFLSAIDAQWYNGSCGVTDINNLSPEEFECLWDSSTKTRRIGAITTATGAFFMIAGICTISKLGWDMAGNLFATGFFITSIIGIPIWITGAVRKSQLKKTPNYKIPNSGSLNLSPAIGLNHYNGTQYLGLSLSLNF